MVKLTDSLARYAGLARCATVGGGAWAGCVGVFDRCQLAHHGVVSNLHPTGCGIAKDEKKAFAHSPKTAQCSQVRLTHARRAKAGLSRRVAPAARTYATLGRATTKAVLWALAGVLWAFSTANAADVIKGADLYKQHCAGCHGGDGRPVMPTAPDFSRPTALLKPDLALLGAIRDGKGAMPAYQGLLRDRDILDIVAHLRTLR
jgi:cytochrome c6